MSTFKSGDELLWDLWLRACGKPETPDPQNLPDLAELRRTEWSDEFERLMKNRLIMGSFRYGLFKAADKGNYDLLSEAVKRMG